MRKLLVTGLLLGCSGLTAQSIVLDNSISAPTTVPKQAVSMDVQAIDKSVDPCTDFFEYACGNWRKANPIPADKVRWGRFDELAERNRYLLYKELKTAADNPKTPLQRKYGSYFAACMNVDLANKLGTKPIEPALDSIAKWNDKSKLAALWGDGQDLAGYSFFFGFGSEQDQKDSTKQIAAIAQRGLTLPDRDYYLQNDDRMKKIREQYVEHLTKMFTLLGDSPEKAATEAASVMKIETALAEGSTPRVDLRDPKNVYHVMTRAELQSMTPAFQWDDYFKNMHEDALTSLNVATPNYFKALNEQINTASVDDWRSYMRWHVLNRFAESLSEPFDDEAFRFHAILTGQKEKTPRWKRCTAETDSALGEAVGQDWVKEHFPPAAKDNMLQMVKALEASLDKDIQGLDWMSDATKAEAKKKLMAFRRKIGYPETWRDYSSVVVKKDDPVGNRERAAVFEQRRDLNKIGKPVDEKEWGMTPPTVNAYYDPSMNDINFPAGILQPPFYDFKIDPAVNFGAIGMVIGHEMTHGFDDEGSQFDEKGNVRMWWTDEDRKKFDQRTECEVNEYNKFEPVPGTTLNGKLTLGENTADNGGMRIAYAALMDVLAKQGAGAMTKKVDGYTPQQRFFLGYAQVWCENTRPETARLRAKVDPHSPGRFRVNGVVQNFEKFGEAFGCKKGQPMMPENVCRVW